jgi:hypothetical protein
VGSAITLTISYILFKVSALIFFLLSSFLILLPLNLTKICSPCYSALAEAIKLPFSLFLHCSQGGLSTGSMITIATTLWNMVVFACFTWVLTLLLVSTVWAPADVVVDGAHADSIDVVHDEF